MALVKADLCGPARYAIFDAKTGLWLSPGVGHDYNGDNREVACDACAAKWSGHPDLQVRPLKIPEPFPDHIERVRHDNQPMPWS